MFGKSIYKKMAEDFSFVKDYGFDFQFYVNSNINPSIMYKGKRYRLHIGYSYGYNQEEGFFVSWSDSNNDIPHDKETLDRFAKYPTKNSDFYKDALQQYSDLLEGITLIGKSYKEQVEQVKTVILEHLQKL